MAVLSALNPTLIDLAKAIDPKGQIANVVEVLASTNDIIQDATFVEANDRTSHKHTIRTGYADATWRKYYGGVQPSKGSTAQVVDGLGMLESYAEADAALVDAAPNPAAFRLIEDRAHIEGMNNEFAQTLFYGNEGTAPAEFTGLAPRYNSLSAQNALNIVDHGGSGSDNTSIWLCIWGPNTGFCLYPRGAKGGGIEVTDKGVVTIENADGSNGRMEAYRTHYKWHVGFTVRDWRYFVRVANVDVSDLATVANTKNLVTSMIRASERIPAFGMGRAAWYVNRGVREALRLGILEKVSNNLSWETVEGQRVMMFDGIPVRRCDAIVNTEARVV